MEERREIRDMVKTFKILKGEDNFNFWVPEVDELDVFGFREQKVFFVAELLQLSDAILDMG